MLKWLWHVLHQTVTRWSANDGNLLATSMAYYAAFSFFPMLLVLLTFLGLALEFSASVQDVRTQLVEFLEHNTNPALAGEVDNILAQVRLRTGVRLSLFAWLILLLGAIGIFSQLEAAFDRLWHNPTPSQHGVWATVRNALWNRLKAFLTLIGLGLVLIAAFIANLMFAAVRTWAEEISWAESLVDNGDFWNWSQLALSISLNSVVLTLVYKLIPRAKVRSVHAACGGVVVALLWQLGSQVVARFIVGGNYSAYGVVGSFIAMMLWVYCASVLLLLGAQMVQVLGHPYNNSVSKPAGEPTSPAPPPASAARS